MTFHNIQVAPEDLPVADQLIFEPMAEAYPKEVLVQSIISWGVFLVLSFIPIFVVPDSVPLKHLFWFIPVGLLLMAVGFTVLAWFAAKARGMALREHDIAYRSGLVWRKTIMLAFCRIQHIEISSGPLQRKFDLATLKFFTAGGLNVDMKIDGLQREYAEQLRHTILQRVSRES